MKSFRAVMILFVFCLLFIVGCAPAKNLFVLVPDPDGAVGSIIVSNPAGSQIIDQPFQAVAVRDARTVPSPPQRLQKEEIEKIFGAALKAQPLLPEIFLLYFQPGTAELTDESQALLAVIFAAINRRHSTDIAVVGHTDRVGARGLNYTLGLSRAKRVAGLFVARGIDPSSIAFESHGEDNPLVATADEISEPKNRRVEITVR